MLSPRFPNTLAALLALVLGSAAVAPLAGQASAGGLHATRVELEQMLAAYEQGSRSQEAGAQQIQSQAEASRIRLRLQEGDFQTGDQVLLTIEGQEDLSGTYTVETDQTIALPIVGSIPLRGILRSELRTHLTEHLSRFIRDPRVRAESTVRLMVLGAVGSPGFYSVPSNALITDVIEQAGGTGNTSRLTHIRVERGGDRILAGDQLQQAIIAGRTIDQLNMRAGDRVVVPERRDMRQVRDILWFGTSLVSAVLLLSRIF